MKHATDADKMEALARKAANLYHGPFLNDEAGAPYLRAARDQMRKRFVHDITASVLRLTEAGRRNQAIALCHQVLAADPEAQELFERFTGHHGGRSSIDFLKFP